jgi:molybdopterin molybdotransferase
LQVRLFPRQGSAMLTSATWAEGLAIVDCQRTLEAGELIEYLPFSELLA